MIKLYFRHTAHQKYLLYPGYFCHNFQFVRTQKMDIPLDVMDANLHCKENAAKLLIERMYEILTKRT